MAVHVFDAAAFRLLFPQFADTTLYPDLQLAGYWTMATAYMPAYDRCSISGEQLVYALNLLTAHLAASFTLINANAASGDTTSGRVTSATIGNVSVSMEQPSSASGWQYWLNGTPYGQQLWALLTVLSAGGRTIGGSLERAAFRQAPQRPRGCC